MTTTISNRDQKLDVIKYCPFCDQYPHRETTTMDLLYKINSGDRKRSERVYRCWRCDYEAKFSNMNRNDFESLEYYNDKFNKAEKLTADGNTGEFTSELVKMKTPEYQHKK